MSAVDPEVLKLAEEYLARKSSGRGALALRVMLRDGGVTTEDLKNLGYDHPPRAIADLKDNGIPIVRETVRSSASKRMARYSLGTAEQIRVGQVGRTAISKKFRDALLQKYGSKDCLTLAVHEPRSLQIDHRIPYRVAGDAGLATNDVDAYMLLDGKSQRAKSFSCENCENFISIMNPEICRSCYWAFPENYNHVAMQETRRADLVWQGAEILEYDQIKSMASKQGRPVNEFLKDLGRDALKKR